MSALEEEYFRDVESIIETGLSERTHHPGFAAALGEPGLYSSEAVPISDAEFSWVYPPLIARRREKLLAQMAAERDRGRALTSDQGRVDGVNNRRAEVLWNRQRDSDRQRATDIFDRNDERRRKGAVASHLARVREMADMMEVIDARDEEAVRVRASTPRAAPRRRSEERTKAPPRRPVPRHVLPPKTPAGRRPVRAIAEANPYAGADPGVLDPFTGGARPDTLSWAALCGLIIGVAVVRG